MKEIKAFRTEDGKVFQNKIAATRHESNLAKRKTIESFVEKYCWSGMLKTDIKDVLFDHLDEIA